MRYYLTTPIYYVNASPHIGHAYTTIAADVLVRHHRQRGEETFFLTGTDEHASKVYRVAEEQGLDPKAYVDEIVEKYWRELPKRVDAEYDFFIRTTDEGHKRFVQEFLQRIYDNGDIYQDVYSGLYCVRLRGVQARGRARRRPVPRPRHPARADRGDELVLPALGLPGRSCSRSTTSGPISSCRASATTRRAASSRAASQDFSVSRAGQPWGVPIPWDEEQVTYVWVDALINYLSALTYARDGRGPARAVLAARPPPARQGHPPLPLRLLAGAAARGRLRGAAAAVRPRLPAARRPQDLEVARQRDRPARPDRRLRRRRGPLLGAALGLVRPGRQRLDRRPRTSATSASSATTSATSSRGRRR